MQPLKQLRKIRFALVYNRDSKLNQDGSALVQIRAYHSGKSRFFTTGIYIEPAYWDEKNKRVRETHPLEIQYNAHLQAELQAMKAFELRALQRYGACPLRLLDGYRHEEAAATPNLTFTEFFRKETGRPDIKPGTRRGHRNTFRLFASFQPEVSFEELTYPFIVGFDRHLRRRGLCVNTIHRHHRTVRAYINQAILHDHISAGANPYRKFRPETEEPDRVFLTAEELTRIEALEIPAGQQHMERTRRVFLLACYTGLRFGDVTRLARRHLEETRHGLQVNIRTEKTGKTCTLPLWLLFKTDGVNWSKPEAIVRQAMAEQERFHRRAALDSFPLFGRSNQYLNRELKKLATLAGINKRLTFHVSRRTFATIMAGKVKIPTLQRLLNHSKIDVTMIYVRMSNAAVAEELAQIDWT